MAIWAWLQPVDRIWKVMTDPEKGVVNVYNEKEELVMERKDLKKDDVLLIEENFLNVVATRLADKKPGDVAEQYLNTILCMHRKYTINKKGEYVW